MAHTDPDLDARAPVLVGVGTAFDDVEAVDLMIRATEQAGADAGATELLERAQRIAVPRGTWSYTDPARIVAERIGAPTATTVLTDIGIPQQTLINDVLASVASGDIDVGIVVGAEAKARAARAARRARAADAAGIAHVMGRRSTADDAGEIDQHGARPDLHQQPAGEIVSQPEIDAGLWAPVEQYALIESALGASEAQPLEEHRRQIAELWSRFNEVARTNPDAAFPKPLDVDALTDLGEENRPLSFPYGKWHASQWTVDQGAALVFCSVGTARDLGISRDRWIFPLVALDSSFALPLTKRRDLHRWPAMRVLGEAAAARLGRPLRDCEHQEVYSCFPVAVRVQQRELGLPLDGTPTITGGMAFAGGPFNSFVLQATAEMARRLRREPGAGLVTTVSGLLTKPGLAVWSSRPDGRPPLVADLASPAADATGTAPVLARHQGDATVAAATVTYDGMDPRELVAVVRTDAGAHAIAKSTRDELLRRAVTTGIVGRTARVAGNELDSVGEDAPPQDA